MRLKADPSKPDGTNNVFAKAWPADGMTPEPTNWVLKWNDTQSPFHGGFAGITGCSSGGTGQLEVDYILIKSAGLPSITVNFPATPPGPIPPMFTSIVANTNHTVSIDWFGGGSPQSATNLPATWTSLTNTLPPLTISLTNTNSGPITFYRIKE